MIYFIVRTYDGNDIMSSFQSRALEGAIKRHNYFRAYIEKGVEVVFERMTNLDVKNKYKFDKLSQVFDWLLESSSKTHVYVYLLLCHIHQGFMHWRASMEDLKAQYKRLAAHGHGLPREGQVNCPVFTQDKFDYLKVTPEFVNPTLKVPVSESLSVSEWSQVESFYKFHCYRPSGCVVKAPFTTNKTWLKYPKKIKRDNSSTPSVEGSLQKAYEELGGSIPYVMMQPCIDFESKREKKVVFLGGKASRISTGFSSCKRTFPFVDADVVKFAQCAYDTLVSRLGQNHWLDQLARVDVMYNEFESRMVVNEVESLVACYEVEAVTHKYLDIVVENFLEQYFFDQLEELVTKKIEEILTKL